MCVCICMCVCVYIYIYIYIYIYKETLLAIGFPHDRWSMLDQLPGVS